MFSYDSSFLVLPLFPERFIGINIEAWLRIFVLMENFSWTFGRKSSKMTAWGGHRRSLSFGAGSAGRAGCAGGFLESDKDPARAFGLARRFDPRRGGGGLMC